MWFRLSEKYFDGYIKIQFHPAEELYGTTDADLSMGLGSNFYDVRINKAATEDQIAGVLAHEIGHNKHKHTMSMTAWIKCVRIYTSNYY